MFKVSRRKELYIIMYGLYILTGDNFINGYRVEILDLFSLVSIICGILVIISKNPIISVLFLIGLFLSVSCYLITLGVNFIGLSYLLVYVGAVSILFLFILMLINVRISELVSNTSNSIPLAIILGICFYYTVSEILPSNHTSFNSFIFNLIFSISEISYIINTGFINKILNIFTDKGEIVYVTSKTWDGSLAENSHITSIGNIMYTNYLMWLILTSMILLLAMVGAIVITIKQK